MPRAHQRVEVGDARKQNGFVVVLAIDDDDYGWMPGTGLDLELSAGAVHELADTYLEPDFAARDYDAGARKFLTFSLSASPTSAART